MNRTSAFLVCLLICAVVFVRSSTEAAQIYLQDGWQASVTNVQFLVGYPEGDPFPHWTDGDNPGWRGPCEDSSHIAVQTETDPELPANWVNFDMTSGWVTLGQEDAYVTSMPALSNWYQAVQFDWTTNWTDVDAAQHLRFEVWGLDLYLPPPSYYMYDCFYPGFGLRSGHAIMWTNGTGTIELHLVASPVAAPEPSSLLLLASGLAGLGAVRYWRRKR
jgi:hypothetical protein